MELIDEDLFEAANRRGAARKAAFPAVIAARYDLGIARIVLSLDSGVDLCLPLEQVAGCERALPADLDVVEISPSGFGVHFPKIDADMYLPLLFEQFLGSRRRIRHAANQTADVAKAPD